jgi:transcriptional regulator of acetoin/glycerol metabolism
MRVAFIGDRHKDKNYLREVIDLREKFFINGECQNGNVRPLVMDSWRRCLSSGVNAAAETPRIVDDDGLECLLDQHQELVIASKSVAAGLSDILDASKSVFLLTDPHGVVLDTQGDRSIFNSTKYEHINPGYIWSENTSGTNAIGTAITLKQAVEIHSVEHFCDAAQMFTCAAAPILDTFSGEVVGAIDVTARCVSYNARNIGMALTAARHLEELLRSRYLLRRMHLIDWFHGKNRGWDNDAFILFDEKGRVVKFNKAAEEYFKQGWIDQPLKENSKLVNYSEGGASVSMLKMPDSIDNFEIEAFGEDRQHQGGLLVIKGARRTNRASKLLVSENEINGTGAFDSIVGESEIMKNLKARAYRMAKAEAPVLILGDTGCGKELFAKAIHDASPRSDGPFVAVNCGAITRELVSSELFGYEGGAFTGANPKGRAGKFEQADGGTIFLDEIGELPLDMQVNLLRILQEKVVLRLGGNRERKVSIRVIAATNRNLEKEVENGNFRQDLFYRLKVMMLTLPSLKSRQSSDRRLLVKHFLDDLTNKYNMPSCQIAPEVEQFFESYDWPGNVRELYNVLESMLVLSDSEVLQVHNIPDDLIGKLKNECAAEVSAFRSGELAEIERQSIIAGLARHKGNCLRVAQQLGIARSTLYRKMKSYGIKNLRKSYN